VVGICTGDGAHLAGRELSAGGQNLKDFTAKARRRKVRKKDFDFLCGTLRSLRLCGEKISFLR
jgi:hypothetical protein